MNIVVVDISVPSDAFGLGQVLQDHGDLHIDLVQGVPTGDTTVPYFWAETADTEAFEETVRADDRVERLIALDDETDRTMYKVDWADEPDGFLSAVAAHDLFIESGTGTAERWRFRVRGPDHGNLTSFQATLQERGIPIEILRIYNPHAPSDELDGITDKQREALELAFTEGYFDVPRDTSLSILGDELGITGQSLSRRLSRGINTLLGNTLMADQ